jgi:hypothetical protein
MPELKSKISFDKFCVRPDWAIHPSNNTILDFKFYSLGRIYYDFLSEDNVVKQSQTLDLSSIMRKSCFRLKNGIIGNDLLPNCVNHALTVTFFFQTGINVKKVEILGNLNFFSD